MKTFKRLADKRVSTGLRALSKAAFAFKMLPDRVLNKTLDDDEELTMICPIV